MFYEPDKNDHGLRYNPFKSICVPRPIAWVSSLSPSGVPNLAPFSQFTNVSYDPPHVLFCPRADTDTARNVAETGEFVINMATYELRHAVNATSAVVPPEIDEAALADLEMAPSRLVKPPRVKASPCALECKRIKIVTIDDIGGKPVDCHVVFGQVVGVHIDDRFIVDGRLDTAAMKPIARCGYDEYAVVESLFSMQRPLS